MTWAALQFLRAWKNVKDFNDAIDAQSAHDSRAIWDSDLAVILLGDIPFTCRSVPCPSARFIGHKYQYVIDILTSRACADLSALTGPSPDKRRSYVSPSIAIEDSLDNGLMVFTMTTVCQWNDVWSDTLSELFQAHEEQILWRAASAGMACSPLIFVVILLIRDIGWFGSWIREQAEQWLSLVAVGTCIYVYSRITIVVLMFLSLRSLPPGAYDTVVWTKFIPHVNL
jgi:hypothetical protein